MDDLRDPFDPQNPLDASILAWAEALADDASDDPTPTPEVPAAAQTDSRARSASTPPSSLEAATRVVERIARAFRANAIAPHESTGRSEPASFRWGPFLVFERLGAGSQGEVYRAVDARLTRSVALKLAPVVASDPTGSAWRFLEEARRLAQIRNDHVVTVLGADLNAHRVGYWMELVDGLSLDEILREQGPLAPTDLIGIGRDLCAALGAIHDAGFVHGDIKASNVMREDTGRIVLVDFGSAVEIPGSPSRSGSAGEARPRSGTPATLAPEVFEGAGVSVQTDVYALGVLLYRLASGAYPLDGTTFDDVRTGHRGAAYRDLQAIRGDLPESLRAVIGRALAVDPAARFQNMADFLEGLDVCGRSPVSLPYPTTSFVGRDDERKRLESLVQKHRLVTVTGAGGMGKSRLALEVVRSLGESLRGELCFCDVSSAGDVTDSETILAAQLGIAEAPGHPLARSIAAHLASKPVLLILDGCEHLLPEFAHFIHRLLECAPHLRILATSRERLGTPGEAVFRTPGLDDEASIVLFRSRAAAAGASDVLDDSTLPTEQELCRRLDGIPLALELAAAQLAWMSISDLRTHLETRADPLDAQGITAPRHRTLSAVIDWSHDRLDEPERTVFRRLAVLSGGWTLDDAAAIVAETDGDSGIDVSEAKRLMVRLNRKSLVERWSRRETRDARDTPAPGHDGPARYRLLETLRHYALDRLRDAGEEDRLRWRQSDRYAKVAIAARERIRRGEAEAGLGEMQEEGPNLIRALETRLPRRGDDEAVETTAALINSLAHFWFPQGRLTEARETYDRFLAAGPGGRTAAWAGVWMGAGVEAWGRGDLEQAARRTEEALSIYRELGASHGVALTLANLALVEFDSGNYPRSRELLEESLALARERGDAFAEGDALLNLGALALETGDLLAARGFMDAAHPILAAEGSSISVCRNLLNRTRLEMLLGNDDEARRGARHALEMARQSFDQADLAIALLYVARTSPDGDRPAAMDALHRAIEVAHASQEWGCEAESWSELAGHHLDLGSRLESEACLRHALTAVEKRQFRDRERIAETILSTAARVAMRSGRTDRAACWSWSEASARANGRLLWKRDEARRATLHTAVQTALKTALPEITEASAVLELTADQALDRLRRELTAAH